MHELAKCASSSEMALVSFVSLSPFGIGGLGIGVFSAAGPLVHNKSIFTKIKEAQGVYILLQQSHAIEIYTLTGACEDAGVAQSL